MVSWGDGYLVLETVDSAEVTFLLINISETKLSF